MTESLSKSLTKRYVSPGAEIIMNRQRGYEIKGHPSGYVRLEDYMGGDPTIYRAATATRGKDAFKKLTTPETVFSFLTTNKIMTPFSFAQLKLAIQAPISEALRFVYVRSANVNEYSGRYSEMLDSASLPVAGDVAKMMLEAGGDPANAEEIVKIIANLREENFARYKQMLEVDFARELARSGLGSNNDTRFYLKLSIDGLASMVRSGPGDSPTTRLYKNAIASIASETAPIAWDVLMANNYGRTSIRDLEAPRDIKLECVSDEEIVDSPLSGPLWKPAKTSRPTVSALEDLLFAPIKVLDKGEIQAVDYMGDDSSPAIAARTSYGKGTRTLQEDRALTRSLVRDRHNTPLEMVELAIEIKAPVLIQPRQFGRHRTVDNTGLLGATPIGSEHYVPDQAEMKYQDRINRQGRKETMTSKHKAMCFDILDKSAKRSLQAVSRMRELGAPEELIRQQKGVGFYTIGSMTSDAHNWGGFISLRADPHAQKEAQPYAEAVKTFLHAQVPIVYEALEDYRFKALTFSLPEQRALGQIPSLLSPETELTPGLFKDTPFSQIDKKDPSQGLKFSREGEGFVAKLHRFRNLREGFNQPSS